MNPIYFDNNATTYLDPHVAQHMHELALQGIANPASQHAPGRRALNLLEDAKTTILRCVGAPTSGSDACKLILTSGGTEANNLAIFGSYYLTPGTLIVGGSDHPSVIEAGKTAVRASDTHDCRVLPVDVRGQCDLELLKRWLDEIYSDGGCVSLVSIMLGNNETGIVQDLKSICSICQQYNVPVHSDVVQAVGKMSVDMIDLGLSALTLTGHKIHGPVGVGVLIAKENLALEPVIVGGGQQLGLRAGTEPVIPTCGLAMSLSRICDSLSNGEYAAVQGIRDQFETRITQMGDFRVVGKEAPRLPHTSNIAFVGVDRQALHMSLDLNGLACSTGSACSSGSGRPSGSLVAMGLDDEAVQGSLRFSFSRYSTLDELERATKIIEAALTKCGHVCC